MKYGYEEIKNYILDNITDYEGINGDELHNGMFNTNYYIIGTYKAKKWCGDRVFDIIETIREYETENFGEVTTDFSDPEKVVNMYVYILGEEILSEVWDELDGELTKEKIETIKEKIA